MIELVIALALGYVIGLLQNGITINHKGEEFPEEVNKSVGIESYMQYHEDTNGENKF